MVSANEGAFLIDDILFLDDDAGVQTHIENLYTTVGVHPTRCTEFDNWEKGPEDYMQLLISLVEQDTSHRIVAVGEFGLGNTKNSRSQNLLFFTANCVFILSLLLSS